MGRRPVPTEPNRATAHKDDDMKMMKTLCPLMLLLSLAGWKAQAAKTTLPLFMAWDNEKSFKTLTTDADMEKYLQRLKAAHVDGLFMEGSAGFIRKIAPIANKVGMQLHVWKPTMIMADSVFMHAHEDWYSVNRNGESCVTKPPYVPYYRIFCPREPQVLEYLANIYLEYAKIDGVAGIHFDYIRYCDIFLPKGLLPKYHLEETAVERPEYDFCYCHRCREAFKAKTGIDPLLLKDPASNKKWADFRLKAIVDLANTIAAKVKKQTGKMVTAAVFPTPEMSARMVRQDWGHFKIDAVCPMLYNSLYAESTDWIGHCVKEGIATMAVRKDLHAGLYMGLQDPKELQAAIESAMNNGANGVVFFTANLKDSHLAIIKQMYEKYKQ